MKKAVSSDMSSSGDARDDATGMDDGHRHRRAELREDEHSPSRQRQKSPQPPSKPLVMLTLAEESSISESAPSQQQQKQQLQSSLWPVMDDVVSEVDADKIKKLLEWELSMLEANDLRSHAWYHGNRVDRIEAEKLLRKCVAIEHAIIDTTIAAATDNVVVLREGKEEMEGEGTNDNSAGLKDKNSDQDFAMDHFLDGLVDKRGRMPDHQRRHMDDMLLAKKPSFQDHCNRRNFYCFLVRDSINVRPPGRYVMSCLCVDKYNDVENDNRNLGSGDDIVDEQLHQKFLRRQHRRCVRRQQRQPVLHFVINEIILQPGTVYERSQFTFGDTLPTVAPTSTVNYGVMVKNNVEPNEQCTYQPGFDSVPDLIRYYVGGANDNAVLSYKGYDDKIGSSNTMFNYTKHTEVRIRYPCNRNLPLTAYSSEKAIIPYGAENTQLLRQNSNLLGVPSATVTSTIVSSETSFKFSSSVESATRGFKHSSTLSHPPILSLDLSTSLPGPSTSFHNPSTLSYIPSTSSLGTCNTTLPKSSYSCPPASETLSSISYSSTLSCLKPLLNKTLNMEPYESSMPFSGNSNVVQRDPELNSNEMSSISLMERMHEPGISRTGTSGVVDMDAEIAASLYSSGDDAGNTDLNVKEVADIPKPIIVCSSFAQANILNANRSNLKRRQNRPRSRQCRSRSPQRRCDSDRSLTEKHQCPCFVCNTKNSSVIGSDIDVNKERPQEQQELGPSLSLNGPLVTSSLPNKKTVVNEQKSIVLEPQKQDMSIHQKSEPAVQPHEHYCINNQEVPQFEKIENSESQVKKNKTLFQKNQNDLGLKNVDANCQKGIEREQTHGQCVDRKTKRLKIEGHGSLNQDFSMVDLPTGSKDHDVPIILNDQLVNTTEMQVRLVGSLEQSQQMRRMRSKKYLQRVDFEAPPETNLNSKSSPTSVIAPQNEISNDILRRTNEIIKPKIKSLLAPEILPRPSYAGELQSPLEEDLPREHANSQAGVEKEQTHDQCVDGKSIQFNIVRQENLNQDSSVVDSTDQEVSEILNDREDFEASPERNLYFKSSPATIIEPPSVIPDHILRRVHQMIRPEIIELLGPAYCRIPPDLGEYQPPSEDQQVPTGVYQRLTGQETKTRNRVMMSCSIPPPRFEENPKIHHLKSKSMFIPTTGKKQAVTNETSGGIVDCHALICVPEREKCFAGPKGVGEQAQHVKSVIQAPEWLVGGNESQYRDRISINLSHAPRYNGIYQPTKNHQNTSNHNIRHGNTTSPTFVYENLMTDNNESPKDINYEHIYVNSAKKHCQDNQQRSFNSDNGFVTSIANALRSIHLTIIGDPEDNGNTISVAGTGKLAAALCRADGLVTVLPYRQHGIENVEEILGDLIPDTCPLQLLGQVGPAGRRARLDVIERFACLQYLVAMTVIVTPCLLLVGENINDSAEAVNTNQNWSLEDEYEYRRRRFYYRCAGVGGMDLSGESFSSDDDDYELLVDNDCSSGNLLALKEKWVVERHHWLETLTRHRAAALDKWIRTAADVKQALGNVFGYRALMSALCSDRMHSLREVWASLRQHHTTTAVTFESRLRPEFLGRRDKNIMDEAVHDISNGDDYNDTDVILQLPPNATIPDAAVVAVLYEQMYYNDAHNNDGNVTVKIFANDNTKKDGENLKSRLMIAPPLLLLPSPWSSFHSGIRGSARISVADGLELQDIHVICIQYTQWVRQGIDNSNSITSSTKPLMLQLDRFRSNFRALLQQYGFGDNEVEDDCEYGYVKDDFKWKNKISSQKESNHGMEKRFAYERFHKDQMEQYGDFGVGDYDDYGNEDKDDDATVIYSSNRSYISTVTSTDQGHTKVEEVQKRITNKDCHIREARDREDRYSRWIEAVSVSGPSAAPLDMVFRTELHVRLFWPSTLLLLDINDVDDIDDQKVVPAYALGTTYAALAAVNCSTESKKRSLHTQSLSKLNHVITTQLDRASENMRLRYIAMEEFLDGACAYSISAAKSKKSSAMCIEDKE